MFEEVYLEKKAKKILIMGLVLILFLISIFILVKIFILKPSPPPSPLEIPPLFSEEVVIKYFELEQEKNREESEKYLFSDLSKVEIFGENYQKQNLQYFLWTQPEEKEGPLPEYQIKSSQIEKSKAKIILEVTTSKMEGSLFFNFYLPKKVIFETDLVKEGGYWKIIRIDSPDLVSKSEPGEEIEIKENIFVKPIKIGDYISKERKPVPGFKFLYLEIEFENKSIEAINLYQFIDWRIIDEKNQIYYPIPKPGLATQQTLIESSILIDFTLNPGSTKEIHLFFEVPEEILIKEVIFRSQYKKIIFKID